MIQTHDFLNMTMNHDSLFLNHDSLFLNHDSLFLNHDSLFLNHDSWLMSHDSWFMIHHSGYYLMDELWFDSPKVVIYQCLMKYDKGPEAHTAIILWGLPSNY